MTELSLTRTEAEERAALVTVERYDVDLDLTDLLTGVEWRSTSHVHFRCATPGATTFLDAVGEVRSVRLNGVELDVATAVSEGRITLADLDEVNEVVVDLVQADTASATGILRTVDPTDGLVYVWSSFEADDARRAFACFDQPDLKAPHAFTVLAPASWTVTSNRAPESVVDSGEDARTWVFPDTPPLSTYVVVVNAGPFHEIREQRGGHSLGLFCRQSIKQFLERDAEELLTLTEQGLAFYAETFGQPFGQERYDQVFVPDMGGAMENWGCVTWGDMMIPRSEPTAAEREYLSLVLLHEMAHMWFGDLVTMRWWDDLWLNEAFASFASAWAASSATAYSDAWATFAVAEEPHGYRQDAGPASHPIRGEVPDVGQAMANFDAITYLKGQAVLRQLLALLGEDVFADGLQRYFSAHAWGNTVLADLIGALEDASGRDLSGWTSAWLDRAGTDTVSLELGEPAALVVDSPDDEAPRPHTIAVRSFTRADDGGLTEVATTTVETTGVRTPLPGLPDVGEDGLHLLNADDLAFVHVRPDARSLGALTGSAAALGDTLDRAVAAATALDLLHSGDLDPGATLDVLLDVLAARPAAGLVEPLLDHAAGVATLWTPAADTAAACAELAEVSASLAEHPGYRSPALRTLASVSADPRWDTLLEDAAVDDVPLGWRLLRTRAAAGRHDADDVLALTERDPDPEAWVSALGVEAALPEQEAKEAAFERMAVQRDLPRSEGYSLLVGAFWRPDQHALVRPFADRYLDVVSALDGGAMLNVYGLVRSFFPRIGDQAFLDRASAIAADPDVVPAVRTNIALGADTLRRYLLARGELD
ncbi:aminopeptidase N [Nocardioides sp. GY 10127]|uniref:aminopeptidase N n=1 Tax=Nocardioides sp. GY 10127 TaxID=2569762 RepID=UPI0010A91810|nr:aminopeptidase N [Nocardioides sp. GY 10127]TIC86350.1 aminopeptidase N [Nocardioides sp. GY 10127]